MYAKDYRKLAKEQYSKYVGELVIIQLVFELIALAIGLLGLVNLTHNRALEIIFALISTAIIIVVSGPFDFAFVHIGRKVYDNNTPETKDLFIGFKDRFSQAFTVGALKIVYLFLWSLLLVIPGIIKSFSYSMAEYIAYDDPKITCNDAITKSRELMNGRKGKLFCLEISYIGWIILCILTFGILGLWVLPKINQAKYNFYLNALKESKASTVNK